MTEALELWGGVECTVNRVGDVYRDQLRLSGHHRRLGDLDAFASIGFKAMRYPALWERISPHAPGENNWRWTDERLPRLRALGIEPIVGLIHHGSGPRYTGLLEESFAPGLAAHARAVAERYPWIERWTPVNEPLTTARFSALYGHWHPHLAEERAFWLALLNQIDATRLSMAAIRQVNPAAKLVQTEDLGRTYSTADVQHQADFDNERRWMTWDLLCGRVTPGHALWRRLTDLGFGPRLEAIALAPCPADIVGVNHYLTSDRFLDGRPGLHPPGQRAGNGRDAYADVAAVRVLDRPPSGLESALDEAWKRYGAPLAVTESHNGCTREEQMRWTFEAWQVALRLRTSGVDIRAVTAWAILGSYDWDSLLTRPAGRYEPGAFDVRGGVVRGTAVARMLEGISRPGAGQHEPSLDGLGWWRREARRTHPSPGVSPRIAWPKGGERVSDNRILIIGSGGALGLALTRACETRNLAHSTPSSSGFDPADPRALEKYLEAHRPWALINAAGTAAEAWPEDNTPACREAYGLGAITLARACRAAGVAYLGFSSDQVFRGDLERSYLETDAPAPQNVYGRCKAAADEAILGEGGQALIIRSAAFFGPESSASFARCTLEDLAHNRPVFAPDNRVISPTYLPDLADAALDLLIDREVGLRHLSSGSAVSWSEFAAMLAEQFRLDSRLIESGTLDRREREAPRYTALGSRHGAMLAPLSDALRRFEAALGAVPV